MPIRDTHHRARMAAALFAGLLANASFASTALAGAVQIRDTASMLSPQDEAQLRTSASRYPFDVRVVTTGDQPDRSAFSRYVAAQLSTPNMVVVGIDPTNRLTSVHFGTGTSVARQQFAQIENAGDNSFRQRDWRGGIDAILASANSAISSAPTAMPPGSVNTAPMPAPTGGGPYQSAWPANHNQRVQRGFPGGGLVLLGLLALGGLIIAMVLRRRRAAMGGTPGANPPFGQGQGNFNPGPGNYPGNQPGGANYGSGGMGALGGGALGAGLGGILGYGLGRASAEREQHHEGGGTAVGGGPASSATGSPDAGGSTSGWEDTGEGHGGGDSGGGDGGGDGGGSDW